MTPPADAILDRLVKRMQARLKGHPTEAQDHESLRSAASVILRWLMTMAERRSCLWWPGNLAPSTSDGYMAKTRLRAGGVRGRRRETWLSLMAAVSVFAGCSSSSPSPPSPAHEPPGPVGGQPGVPTCSEGQPCSCPPGKSGKTTCVAGSQSCECVACPSLETKTAPAIAACEGDPFGVWRLKELELGTSLITLSSFGETLGHCEVVYDTPATLPRSLMALEDGGHASYVLGPVLFKAHWSEACVTDFVESLSCGAKGWSDVFDCELSCDICSCNTRFKTPTYNQWSRTSTKLSVSPLGAVMDFDYCAKDGQLSLANHEARLVYERVFPIDTPKPCAARSADECGRGEGCYLGACVGSAECEKRTTESSCLTTQDCSWNAAACSGVAKPCALADYGVVPGCDLALEHRDCTGTPTSTCGERGTDDCEGLRGCSVNDRGKCAGPKLQCAGSWCPQPYCSGTSLECTGVTSCEAFESETACADANEYFPDASCAWLPAFCEGSAEPCASYSQSECESVPGCQLGEVEAPAP